MKLSVVIPCFNAASTIKTQLEAFSKQECSDQWEIIIADNGSTDQTTSIVKKYLDILPNLRLVDASDVRGAAHARNVGTKFAQAEAIAFCDADDKVCPKWVQAMIEGLSQHDFVAGCSNYTELNEPWVVKCCEYREANGIKDYPYFPYAAGNNLGVKRSLHEFVGGFDESLLRLQDIDYCWRIQKAGAKLHSVKDAIVYFRFRNTVKDMYLRCWVLGCYDVFLHQKHQRLGMPILMRWRDSIKDALILFIKFPVRLRSKDTFIRWLLDLAWLMGHLQGFFKYRYLIL